MAHARHQGAITCQAIKRKRLVHISTLRGQRSGGPAAGHTRVSACHIHPTFLTVRMLGGEWQTGDAGTRGTKK
jgi:hypothetical protein